MQLNMAFLHFGEAMFIASRPVCDDGVTRSGGLD